MTFHHSARRRPQRAQDDIDLGLGHAEAHKPGAAAARAARAPSRQAEPGDGAHAVSSGSDGADRLLAVLPTLERQARWVPRRWGSDWGLRWGRG